MKIKKYSKKGLALGLAGLVAAQSSLQADWASDFSSDSLTNVTSESGTIDSKKGGFYSSGNVYFRFGPGMSRYEPFFHISPPDISAGCNGFNLKGLFVSFIGFERIAKMLKSAGASFAWGIVVGLIYSLPGIFSAFKMLNTWAKKIMQLLQNACKSGQDIGKSISDISGFTNLVNGGKTNMNKYISKLSPQSAADAAESGTKTVMNYFGIKSSTFFGSNDQLNNSDLDDNTLEGLRDAYGTEIIRILGINSYPSTFFRSYIDKVISTGNPDRVKDLLEKVIGKTTLTDEEAIGSGLLAVSLNGSEDSMSKKGKISVLPVGYLVNSYVYPSTSDKLNQTMLFIINTMIVNTIGRKTVDMSSLESFNTRASAAVKDTIKNKNPSEADKQKMAAFKNGFGNIISKYENENTSTASSLAESFGAFIASTFVGATAKEAADYQEKFGKWNAPLYAAIITQESETDGVTTIFGFTEANSKAYGGYPAFGSDQNNLSSYVIKTKTFEEKSLEYIEKIVNDNEDPQTAATLLGIPLLMAPTLDFIRIAKQTPSGDREVLLKSLAESNMCSFAIGVTSFLSSVKNEASSTAVPYTINSGIVEISTEKTVSSKSTSTALEGITLNEIMSSFKSGFVSKLLENINISAIPENADNEGKMSAIKNYCSGVRIKVIKDFAAQDTINRKRAASTTNSIN